MHKICTHTTHPYHLDKWGNFPTWYRENSLFTQVNFVKIFKIPDDEYRCIFFRTINDYLYSAINAVDLIRWLFVHDS